MPTSGPRLSGIRTILFGALAVVWLTEMTFLGFRPLSSVWTHLWQVVPPADPQLATALSITWAVAAPAKGALCLLAVFGLLSRNPSTRTALFASMALVPPLNIAFPFRQQGFLPGPVAVASVLSAILWGSFFLFRESASQPEGDHRGDSGRSPPSPWETVRYAWFACYSIALTLLALLLLFRPRTALPLLFPWLSGLFNTHEAELTSLVHTGMASGTHLLALAIATWIATFQARRNPSLRRAAAVAGTAHAGLFGVFPLPQIIMGFGAGRAATSMLIGFVPLFVCWVLYAIAETTRTRTLARSDLPNPSLEGMP